MNLAIEGRGRERPGCAVKQLPPEFGEIAHAESGGAAGAPIRKRGIAMQTDIAIFGLVAFLVIGLEHVASRHYTFRHKIGPPWDLGIGLASLGSVYSGLLAMWWAAGVNPGIGTALWAFWAVVGAGWAAVGLAYGVEKLAEKWRKLREENLRLKRRMDEMARGEEDGHRQRGVGPPIVGASRQFTDGLDEEHPKPN